MGGSEVGHLGRKTALGGGGKRGRGADGRFYWVGAVCGGGRRLARREVRRRGRGWLGLGLGGDKAQGRERDQLRGLGSRGAEGGEGGEWDGGRGGEGWRGADVRADGGELGGMAEAEAEGERGARHEGVGRGKPSVADGCAGGHVGWRDNRKETRRSDGW